MNKSKKRPGQSQAPMLLVDSHIGEITSLANPMQRFALRVVPAFVAMGLAFGAQAQSEPKVQTVSTTDGPIPYVLSAGDINITRGVSARCIRSSTWSLEAIKTVRFKETGKPVGCFCEPELLAKEVCSPPAPAPAAPPVAAPPPAPAPVTPPAPVLAPVPSAEKVNIPSDALFAYDKAEISDIGLEKLGEFANRVKDINLEVITAVGHADRIGSDSYNQKLSEKRANSVKDFLIGRGVPANRIYTEGKGETQPVTGDSCKNMGAENKRNRKLIDCLGADRRVELEAVGTRNPK